MIYLVWLSRRRINFVRLVTFGFLAIGILGVSDFVVSRYTRTGSVFERLVGTELEGGIVPETRAGVWKQASENVMDHPIVGHGPFYAAERGLETLYWPHSLYLYYAYIVGFVGLAFFLWILAVLWKATRPRAPSPGSGTYVQGATVIFRAMLFMFIVDQIKIEYLRNERYSFYIWFMFGLMIAIDRVAKREASEGNRAVEAVASHDATPRLRPARPAAVSARPAVGGT
jgi:O-antigen ligase